MASPDFLPHGTMTNPMPPYGYPQSQSPKVGGSDSVKTELSTVSIVSTPSTASTALTEYTESIYESIYHTSLDSTRKRTWSSRDDTLLL